MEFLNRKKIISGTKYHISSTCIMLAILFVGCKKGDSGSGNPPPPPPPASTSFSFNSFKLNGQFNGYNYKAVNTIPVLKVSFLAPIDKSSVSNSFSFKNSSGGSVGFNISYENNDSTVVVQPSSPLSFLSKYVFSVSTALKSTAGGNLLSGVDVNLFTSLDSSRKFSSITDDALLDLVQKQTLKYFTDLAHPVSGLALERNTSGETVTSGGSGFGIMAIIAGVSRNFITKAAGLAQLQKEVAFLKNTAQTFHGAYPHWLNGTTGAVIPFSADDNGADLVETGFLMQGLLCARQYFSGTSADETTLRADINTIWNRVEWSWFRQNDQNVLYWHWSPDKAWKINLKIQGWSETLMTYILGASSTTFNIPKVVYSSGWAGGSSFTNGNTYYGYTLPLGPNLGGPLFFEHYSFLGVDPIGLSDTYANYETQTKNHTLINYNYCKANPQNYYGYSDSVWGLTASDIPNGYTASSPTNDVGVIAPTAALSSFPYTPTESMKALKFYYYVLGDKLFKQYGFIDAFKLNDPWFADSYLAIDQGPIVVMIENYRSKLLWNLFTGAPEIKAGMKSLGFSAPYLL
ncbi:MAG: glucoamylase family protein [Ferruginibacter sp.]